MEETIFEKIIAGTIPCHKVYEDEFSLAFLDINPIQPGHVLVIPKIKATYVWDLDSESYAALMATVQKVAQHIKISLSAPHVGAKIVGVDVPYAHVHIVPFAKAEQLDQTPVDVKPDHQALAEMAKRLAF